MARVVFIGTLISCGEAVDGPVDLANPFEQDTPARGVVCTIPVAEVFEGGVGKDGIPALIDPEMVPFGHLGTKYLSDDDRVIGVFLEDQPFAVPHNVGWYHEIVNLNYGDHRVAVTYCPLTGSSLVFDRAAIGGADFGVSGLLYRSNLIMYDRTSGESFWPQMSRGSRCGPRRGTELEVIPAYDMTWKGWRELYPNTLVVSRTDTGISYRTNPYGNYESLDNFSTLVPVRLDRRRPPKERVLGIPAGRDGGIAVPFGSLGARELLRAVNLTVDGKPIAVFWDGEKQAAIAHNAMADGRPLTFEARSNRYVDLQTGSAWTIDGHAVDGPLKGLRLAPIREAYVAFWFAWALFHPSTLLWTP